MVWKLQYRRHWDESFVTAVFSLINDINQDILIALVYLVVRNLPFLSLSRLYFDIIHIDIQTHFLYGTGRERARRARSLRGSRRHTCFDVSKQKCWPRMCKTTEHVKEKRRKPCVHSQSKQLYDINVFPFLFLSLLCVSGYFEHNRSLKEIFKLHSLVHT